MGRIVQVHSIVPHTLGIDHPLIVAGDDQPSGRLCLASHPSALSRCDFRPVRQWHRSAIVMFASGSARPDLEQGRTWGDTRADNRKTHAYNGPNEGVDVIPCEIAPVDDLRVVYNAHNVCC